MGQQSTAETGTPQGPHTTLTEEQPGLCSSEPWRMYRLVHWWDQTTTEQTNVQHSRALSSGQDSAVFLRLKKKGPSLEDTKAHILHREDRWFERGVKEVIYLKTEKPSLNRDGLRHHLCPNTVLSSLSRRTNSSITSKTQEQQVGCGTEGDLCANYCR